MNEIEEVRKHSTFNKSIDSIPDVLKSFIPKNYSAINISSGGANLDGLEDKILVLRKNTEETTSNYAEDIPDKRQLLLLLGQNNYKFKLAFRNDNAVLCIDCNTIYYPFSGTTIKNGYFSIEHNVAGGPQHWERVATFKYNKLKKNWFLYKDQFVSYQLNESNDPNAEALIISDDKTETYKDLVNSFFEVLCLYLQAQR